MKVPRPAVKLPADSVPVKIMLAGKLELIGYRVDALPTASRPLQLTLWWRGVRPAAEDWDRAPVWFHGDLLPGNLLFQQGRLCAIIDFGTLGVGDPACDLMVAWNTLPAESRSVFRAALGVDDATWARGRGWALWQALVFIPYYLHTNPVGVGFARRTLAEVLSDHQ